MAVASLPACLENVAGSFRVPVSHVGSPACLQTVVYSILNRGCVCKSIFGPACVQESLPFEPPGTFSARGNMDELSGVANMFKATPSKKVPYQLYANFK